MSRIKHYLTIRLENIFLKDFGRPTSPGYSDKVSSSIRELFSNLGGQIDSISVSQNAVKVVWSKEPDEEVRFDQILAMLNKGQYQGAGLILELLLTDEPDNELYLYNLGMVYSDMGILDRSIDYLGRLIKKYPANVNGWVALGVAQMRNKQPLAAIEALQNAVRIDDTNPWAHRNLGAALMQVGKSEEGVEHLRKATELNAKDDKAWYGLGQALEDRGDHAGADEAYQKVIQIDEFGQIADLARQGRNRIAQKSFRSVTPSMERMDAVMYCLGALQKYASMTPEQVRQVGFEVAILGTKGINVNDAEPSYRLRSLPGQYSGLHLVCLEYVAFKQFAPEMDIGFDLSKEYKAALSLYNKQSK